MKTFSISFLLLFFSVQFFAQNSIPIIPKPVEMVVESSFFTIDGGTSLIADKSLSKSTTLFKKSIADISGIQLQSNKNSKKTISFRIDPKIIQSEGYHLSISNEKIDLSANSEQGIFYGIQSILQTLPAIRTNGALQVPAMTIKDYPAFQYRGMHLDVSRHFFSPETVKMYIDQIAKYKMNTFHWHLIDDQGWRMEVKKYPKLTSVGAWRVNRNHLDWENRENQKPGEKADYGGYYTQEQMKEIVKYAENRGVTIIPEIEMPAHVGSAIAAYPNLSCIQKPQTVIPGGIYPREFQTSYCAGNEDVFNFLEDVLDEAMQIFPSKYIHIGGDELDKSAWQKCPKCQKRIKDEGLKDVDELQSYFIHRIEKYLNSKGRKIIGWDEILEGGLAPDATVMSWRGEAGGIAAAKMGHNVIMTPGKPLYFDQYQAGPKGEPKANGGFSSLKNVYDYYPVPKELNNDQKKYVLGAQANLWAEYIKTRSQVEYMVLPRMAALSEILWTPAEQKDYADFRKRLEKQFTDYEQLGLQFSRGNTMVDIKPLIKNNALLVSLSTEIPGAEIYYTTDGTEPNATSKKYVNPFEVNSSINLKAVTVLNNAVISPEPAFQNFMMHKAIGREVKYVNKPSNSYMADGINSLTDGIKGTFAVGKYWHGFYAKDLVATIDLGESKTIEKISLGALQHYKDWIFLPENVKFEISSDGINFKEVGTVLNDIPTDVRDSAIKTFTLNMKPNAARFVRVTAKTLSGAPKNHPGEGKPVWIFADELSVE